MCICVKKGRNSDIIHRVWMYVVCSLVSHFINIIIFPASCGPSDVLKIIETGMKAKKKKKNKERE